MLFIPPSRDPEFTTSPGQKEVAFRGAGPQASVKFLFSSWHQRASSCDYFPSLAGHVTSINPAILKESHWCWGFVVSATDDSVLSSVTKLPPPTFEAGDFVVRPRHSRRVKSVVLKISWCRYPSLIIWQKSEAYWNKMSLLYLFVLCSFIWL